MRLRHSLLSPDGVPKPVAPEKQRLVASIEKAVSSISSNAENAEEETEEAISLVRKSLETIASHWSMCKTLATPTARIACRRGVITMRDEVKEERRLIKKLERCGEIYAFEDSARNRCTHLAGKQLLDLVRRKATTTIKVLFCAKVFLGFVCSPLFLDHCFGQHSCSCCQRGSRQLGRSQGYRASRSRCH
jgi:hypothetical protein